MRASVTWIQLNTIVSWHRLSTALKAPNFKRSWEELVFVLSTKAMKELKVKHSKPGEEQGDPEGEEKGTPAEAGRRRPKK